MWNNLSSSFVNYNLTSISEQFINFRNKNTQYIYNIEMHNTKKWHHVPHRRHGRVSDYNI